MESPHKLAIAEAQVRAGQTHSPAFVRHVISGRGRSTCRSPAPPGRLFRSLALAQPGRWKADAGAAFPPPAAPRGRHSSGSRRFRAPRPSEVPGSPFKRRSAPRGAPYGAPFALPADRDTFAEFPGLFPAHYRLTHVRLISRSPWRRLAHVCTPRSRSAPSTCHPPTSRAKGPRETSHNSPGRVVEVAALAGSRLRAGSLTPTRGRRFGDQPKQAALAFGMRESLSILGRGAGPRPTRERNRHEQPTHTS